MIKRILNTIIFFSCTCGFSQSNLLWQSYFSYNTITDVSESAQNIYASSENAYFSKNFNTTEIKTTTSVDGLKSATISALYHSDTYNKTFVGNKNGLLLVVNQDGSILYKKGIIDEVPVPSLIKKINHFLEFNGKLYISCDYGITVFDLVTFEFGDTYYIGNGGQLVKIFQTTILNDIIYAVTETNGIKKVALSNPNLVDFNQWQLFDAGNWNGITSIQNKLVALNTNGKVYKHNGVSFDEILNFSQTGLDIRTSNDYIIVTSLNHVYVLNSSFQQVVHINTSQVAIASVTFSCATVIDGNVYIGTHENGILTTEISNPTTFEVVMPDGPKRNNIFRLKKTSSLLWATYGGYDAGFGSNYFFFGVSKYSNQTGWSYVKPELIGAHSLTDIVANPKDENELYISSYYNGLVKIKNDVITLFDQNTNPPNGPENQQVIPGFVLVGVNGPAFDSFGNLWYTNILIQNGLKVLKANNTWQSITDWSNNIENITSERYSKMVIDKNNTKWIPSSTGNGLIAFNENYANKFLRIRTGTDGNLPIIDVRSLAIDATNQLWIGTTRGLRVLSNVDSFKTQTDIQTKPIIIREVIDGTSLNQELFYEQFINDILVDGANRKWVSISDSGVYLISANGQETIYHFTKENSPLPSNNINDLEIDNVTGEVYFATDNGLVSFKGTATKPGDDLNNVFVYPNPVRPEFEGTVKISGLTSKAVVKITDIEGNLVYETTSQGGTIEWDTTSFGKYKVASGVYMILISANDDVETTVKKVMIIR